MTPLLTPRPGRSRLSFGNKARVRRAYKDAKPMQPASFFRDYAEDFGIGQALRLLAWIGRENESAEARAAVERVNRKP